MPNLPPMHSDRYLITHLASGDRFLIETNDEAWHNDHAWRVELFTPPYHYVSHQYMSPEQALSIYHDALRNLDDYDIQSGDAVGEVLKSLIPANA